MHRLWRGQCWRCSLQHNCFPPWVLVIHWWETQSATSASVSETESICGDCFSVLSSRLLTDFYQPDWQTWQTNKQKHWKAQPPCWFQVLFIFWKCGEDLTPGSRKNRNDGKRIGSSVNLLMPLFTKIVWSAQNVQIPALHSLSKKWKWS